MPSSDGQVVKGKYIDPKGKVVGDAELRLVPVSAIKFDPTYQRDVIQTWVAKMMPFKQASAAPVVLSDRMGGPWVIDGGHRVALAKASDVKTIMAIVLHGKTKMDEARLFVTHNRTRTNLTSWALFRAELCAGDAETLEMVTAAGNAGYILSNKQGPRNIVAIDALRYIYRYGGADLLAETLGLIKEVWFDLSRSTSGQVLKGTAIFIASATDQKPYSHERMVRVMSDVAPIRLMLEAQSIAASENRLPSATPSNMAEAFQRRFNKMLPKTEAKLAPLRIGKKLRPTGWYQGKEE